LLDWNNRSQAALHELIPLVDRELHRLAHHYMRRERAGHTLQTTALVNEVYLKLVDQKHVDWKNRAHFFALSAQLMRRILGITRENVITQSVEVALTRLLSTR
jgi:hypothetical protein